MKRRLSGELPKALESKELVLAHDVRARQEKEEANGAEAALESHSSQETGASEFPRLAKQARPRYETRSASSKLGDSAANVETQRADETATVKTGRLASRPAKVQQAAKDTVAVSAEPKTSRMAKQPKAHLKTKQSNTDIEAVAAVRSTHAQETVELSKVAMQSNADEKTKEADGALAAKTADAKAWLAKRVKAHQESKVCKIQEDAAAMESSGVQESEAAKVSKVSRHDASKVAKAAKQPKAHQKPKLAKQAKAHLQTTEAKHENETMTAFETKHAGETKDAKDIDARSARRAHLHQELLLNRSSSLSCQPARREAAEEVAEAAAADKAAHEVPKEEAESETETERFTTDPSAAEEAAARKTHEKRLEAEAAACIAKDVRVADPAKADEEAVVAAATKALAAPDETARKAEQDCLAAACKSVEEPKAAEEAKADEEAAAAAAEVEEELATVKTEVAKDEAARQAEEERLAAEEASCKAREEAKVAEEAEAERETAAASAAAVAKAAEEEATSLAVTSQVAAGAASEADEDEEAAKKTQQEQLPAEEALRKDEDARGAEEAERLPATPQRRRSSSFQGGRSLSPIPPTSPTSVWRSQTAECCSICCDDAPPGEAVRLSCNHGWYCLSCLKRHAEARLDNGSVEVSCPECNQALAERTLRRVLPTSVLEQLERRSLEQAVSAAGDLYACPTANCPFRVALEEGDVARLKCPECKKTCCLRCGAQPYHRGLSCEAYAEKLRSKGKSTGDEELLKWMEETGSKQCPTCRAVVSKQNLEKQNTQYAECHKMQCRNCDTRFCFKCLAVLTATYSCGCTRAEHGFINPKTGRRMNHLKQKAGKK